MNSRVASICESRSGSIVVRRAVEVELPDEGEAVIQLEQEALDVIDQRPLEFPFTTRIGGAEEIEQVGGP